MIKQDSLQNIRPQLNRMFDSRFRGWLEPKMAIQNMHKTKRELEEQCGVATDSPIYNYKQWEIRKIRRKSSIQEPQQLTHQIKWVEFKDKAMLTSTVGVVVWVLAYRLLGRNSKWASLTSMSLRMRLMTYLTILHGLTLVSLTSRIQEFKIFMHHHQHFEALLVRHEQRFHPHIV